MRYFSSLCLSLLLAAPVWADHVQTGGTWNTTGQDTDVSLTGVGAGNTLVTFVGSNNESLTWTVADDVDGTHGAAVIGPIDQTNDGRAYIFVLCSATGGNTTVTASASSAAPDTWAIVVELDGRATSSCAEDSDSAEEATTQTTHDAGTVTATSGADVVTFGWSPASNACDCAPVTSGFVERFQGDDSQDSIAISDDAVAGGSHSPQWSSTSPSQSLSLTVSIAAASGGGATTTVPLTGAGGPE